MNGLVFCLALLLAVFPLHAQEPDYAALETVFLDDALAQLDYDAHAAKLFPIIERSPGSHEALAALRALQDHDENLSGSEAIFTLLEKLALDNFKACGQHARVYAESYVKLARRLDSAKAAAMFDRWGGIREVSVLGPFAEYGPTAHDDAFTPEICCDFAAEQKGVYGPLAWKTLPHFDQNDDRLNLDLHSRHAGSCYYAAALLNCPGECDVVLEFELNCPGKVWLRGAPLIDIDWRKHDYPQVEVNARLAKGDNLLLLKISGLSWFRIAVRAANGQPIEGLKATAPKSGSYPISSGKPLVDMPRVRQEPYYREALARLLREGGDGTAQAVAARNRKAGLCHLALAQAYRIHHLDTEASEAMEQARALLENEALVQVAFIEHIGNSSLYTGSEVNALRRATLAKLLKSEKASAAALRQQALLYARDERVRDAVDHFHLALRKSPKAWLLYLDLAQFYQQMQWRHDWLLALQEARKLAPKSPAVFKAFARFYESHEMPGAALIENLNLAQLRPADPDLRLALITQYLRAARTEQALAIAQALSKERVGDDYALKRLAEVYAALHREDEALAIYRQLAEMTPNPEAYLRPAAEALMAAGKVDAGRKLLEEILKIAPGEHDVRAWLDRLNGTPDAFWTAWALNASEVDRPDIKPADYPQCASVLLLDEQVQIVNEDGSSRAYVHQIRKILTQDGVDAFGKARPTGEICAARTILPGGAVLEPVTFRGNDIEFPGVKIGSLLEIAYLVREESTPWGGMNPARFYFADQTLAEPFIISRFVLVTPKDMQLSVRYHNWTGLPAATQADSGSSRITTWDVRKPRFHQREAFMPSALEFIPWIDIPFVHDWRMMARKLADDALPMLRTTKLLDEFAANLTRDCKSDEQKARAIYDWVNANLTTEGDARTAHQAIKARAGDREKTFAALCHAAGVRLGFAIADAAPEYRGGRVESLPIVDWAGPEEGDFSTRLFIVRSESGRRIFVSLDHRFRPFGVCSARLDFAPAIVWEQGRYELIELPGGEKTRDRFNNRTLLTLAADGSAGVAGVIETIGERSYQLKELLRKQSNEARTRELEEQVSDQLRGFEAEQCAFPDLEKIGKPLTRAFAGKVPALARVEGGKMKFALPLEKFGPLLSPLIAGEERKHDLVMDFDLHQTDDLRIAAPAGWHFANLPQDLILPCAPLSYAITFRVEKNELIIGRRMALGPGRIPVHAYREFVRQIQRMIQTEDTELTLEKDAIKAASPDEIAPREK